MYGYYGEKIHVNHFWELVEPQPSLFFLYFCKFHFYLPLLVNFFSLDHIFERISKFSTLNNLKNWDIDSLNGSDLDSVEPTISKYLSPQMSMAKKLKNN